MHRQRRVSGSNPGWVDVDSEMEADDRWDKQKRIHHTMWPDYYYPNMSELEREDLKFHNGELPSGTPFFPL